MTPDNTPSVILHLALPDDYAQAIAGGWYRCASLHNEGFIHCCTQTQLSGVIERYFQSVERIVLLELDAIALEDDLRWENTVGGEERFPHLYAPLALAHVRSATEGKPQQWQV